MTVVTTDPREAKTFPNISRTVTPLRFHAARTPTRQGQEQPISNTLNDQESCIQVFTRKSLLAQIAQHGGRGECTSHDSYERQVSDADYRQDTALPDRTKRKSVAFSEGTTVVDSNGQITEVNGGHGEKDSAEAHSKPGEWI